MEPLEQRTLLTVNVFVDPVSGDATIKDAVLDAEFGEGVVINGDPIQEDNDVTLSESPDTAGALRVTDPLGVIALAGAVQINSTTVDILSTSTLFIDLQDGDDRLTFTDSFADVDTVGTVDLHMGGPSGEGDVVRLDGSDGAAESLIIAGVLDEVFDTAVLGYAGVSILSQGTEAFNYQGAGGDDDLQVNVGGNNGNESVQLRKQAGGLNSDEVISESLPLIGFGGVQDFTLASFGPVTATIQTHTLAGAATYTFESGDDDTLIIDGLDGDGDSFTVGQDGAGEVQITDNISGVTINTDSFGGAFEDLLIVRGLAGNDAINVAVDGNAGPLPNIRAEGGLGDDFLNASGSTNYPVTLVGEAGDDSILGGAGNDRLEGGEGNDTIRGLSGFDDIFLGDGSDLFVWLNGDGSDVVEGGSVGSDRAQITGDTAGQDIINIRETDTTLRFERLNGFFAIAMRSIEQLDLFTSGGDDIVEVFDLYATEVVNVDVDLGSGTNQITVNGRDVDDNISVTDPFAPIPPPCISTQINVEGLRYDVHVIDPNTTDTLTVLGNDGNDTIKAWPGVEQLIAIELNGGNGNDFLSADATLLGTTGNDTLEGGVGNDSLVGGDGDDLFLVSTGADTMTGGSGYDIIRYSGDEFDNLLAATQVGTTINIAGLITGSIDISGGGIDRFEMIGAGGDDDIIASITNGTIEKLLVGNDGDDEINAAGSNDATILGGDGDDTIIGSPIGDWIEGGQGNDAIQANDGNDTIYGGDGEDGIAGDEGFDDIFGGPGSDFFVWQEGDQSDSISGGDDDTDELLVFATSGTADSFVIEAPDTEVIIRRDIGSFFLQNATGIEQLSLNTGQGDDFVQINDLFTTELIEVNIFVGFNSNNADTVRVEARGTADNLTVQEEIPPPCSPPPGVEILGLTYDVNVRETSNDNDVLIVDGNAGDDIIKAVPGTEDRVQIQFEGGDGDDFLSADATLIGGTGDDFLEGGIGNDSLVGNDGADTFFGGAGNDTMDGGDGTDTILIVGTDENDSIDVRQQSNITNGDQLFHALNGVNDVDTLVQNAGVRTIEVVDIEAGDGDDTIRVDWQDAIGVDAFVNSLRYDVNGGPAQTRDRLGVVDDGTGDLMLYRKGESDSTGTVDIGPANAEPLVANFADIERLDPITAVDGDIQVFKHDPFEFNDTLDVATHLGADNAINVDPTIDPGGDPIFNFPGDQDYYRLVTETTGVLDLQVYFRQIDAVPSGRPGLPGNGDLDIFVYDVDGDLVGNFGSNENGVAFDQDERIRIPAVAGQTYYLQVLGNQNAINNYNITVENYAPPTPYDVELDDLPIGDDTINDVPNNSDTGRSNLDNVTRDNTPLVFFRLDDAILLQDLPGNPQTDSPPDQVIPIPFVPDQAAVTTTPGYRVAVFDNGDSDPENPDSPPQEPIGYARMISPGIYAFDFATDALVSPFVLSDGSHFLSARVQIIDPADPTQSGFGARSDSLEIVVDTVVPLVFFGEVDAAQGPPNQLINPTNGGFNPNDGLHPDSDSHVDGGVDPSNNFDPNQNVTTRDDRVTNDNTPTFWGIAEADSIVRVYLDIDDNGVFNPNVDQFVGQTIAIPEDGNAQSPRGVWNYTSELDLNDPEVVAALGRYDGLRTLFVTPEDLAGNVGEPRTLQIFLDTQGPQITGVEVVGNAAYDLFDPKPSTDGPTPAILALDISVRDLAERSNVNPNFLYQALVENIVETPGNIELVGDHSGNIAIQSVVWTPAPFPAANGAAAMGTIRVSFFEALPDDRFSLIIHDEVVDPANNKLDGESNAAQPQEIPVFPTGDGVPGGDFVARFTVDSRPEIGTACCGSINVDANGNLVFDPEGQDNDATNRDLVFKFGETSDSIFSGNFAAAGALTSSGFDKLGAYGFANGSYRFLLDFNHDGVPDFMSISGFQVAGLPVAGDFAPAHPGDEIGLFDGSFWYLDTNGDNILDGFDTVIAADRGGLPVVGDFNGDNQDDLALFDSSTNVFTFDLNRDGIGDDQIAFGFAGLLERPVAGDLNLDGIDDIGLWVPGRNQQTVREAAEWHFLVSDNPGGGVPSAIFGPFSPEPLGNDIFALYGDEVSLPVFGNFDPPPVDGSAVQPLGLNLPVSVTGGQVSTIQVTGATPGEMVYLVGGTEGGARLVPDSWSLWVNIGNPRILATAIADADGVATLSVLVTDNVVDYPILLQAVEKATYTVGGLSPHTPNQSATQAITTASQLAAYAEPTQPEDTNGQAVAPIAAYGPNPPAGNAEAVDAALATDPDGSSSSAILDAILIDQALEEIEEDELDDETLALLG